MLNMQIEEYKVKLVCLASGEEQFQWTVEGGRLDWTAVKEAFQAEVVHITNEGIPSCFQAGEMTGLTRTKFNQTELQVSVVKKGMYYCHHDHMTRSCQDHCHNRHEASCI